MTTQFSDRHPFPGSGGYVLGTSGDDSMTGTAGADKLAGLDGNDTIDGGAGIDTMVGGLGDDTYVVDNIHDVIKEGTGEGNDTVLASVSYILGLNVDNLTLTGSSAINATGNNLGNVLTGNSADNILDGRSGLDTMDGGDGSDIYAIHAGAEHAAAEIADSGSTGTDEVRFESNSASTLTLFAGDTGIEQVVFGTGNGAVANTTGTAALSLDASDLGNSLTIVGNAGANSIIGTDFFDSISAGAGADTISAGGGADTITGGLGSDTITGGTGADTFVFDHAGGTGNIDTITDFAPGTDVLELDFAIFTAFSGTGAISSAEFYSGANITAAHDADDRLIYNTKTGALYYDADGNGHGAAVQIAILGTTTHPALAYTDFVIA